MTGTKIKKKKPSDTNFFADILAAIDNQKAGENFTIPPELIEEPELISSIFAAGQLPDSSKNTDELLEFKTDYFHAQLNGFIENGIVFDVSADDFRFIDKEQNLKLSDMEFLKLNEAAVLCHLQQSILMKHLFSHSPDQFEDFGFEVLERECLNSPLRITDKTRFEIYCEAVKDVTKKWFTELLEKKEG